MVEFTSYLLGIAGATARSVQRWRLYSRRVYSYRENECVHVATSHLSRRCQAMRAKFTASVMSVPV